MTIERMVREVQAALGVQVDGRPGPETWGAVHRAIVGTQRAGAADSTGRAGTAGAAAPDATTIAAVDARSERTIATLLPEVRPLARALVQQAAAIGIRIQVVSGLRSWDEQAALYAQGRTRPGPVVTHAAPGHSSHNFGIAFDVGVFEGRRYLAESPHYQAVGALGQSLGLDWGGRWKSFPDAPHFALRPAWAAGLSERVLLARLRQRHAEGAAVFA